MKERREAIRRFIEERGEVSIGDLAAAFDGWSEMTIRRDLDYLSRESAIILTRGGARYLPGRYGLSEDIYSEREQRNLPDKQRLAEKALSLFEPGKGIFIDAGTTAMVLARRLPDENMVVVTSAPNIALEIATRKARPAVVMLGGTLARNTISVSNPAVENQLAELNIDTAFMSTSGFDEAAGFSVGHHPARPFDDRALQERGHQTGAPGGDVGGFEQSRVAAAVHLRALGGHRRAGHGRRIPRGIEKTARREGEDHLRRNAPQMINDE